MRAIQFSDYGPPETARVVEIAAPDPGPGQLLVRVRATSVNPIDWKMVSGRYRPLMRASFPLIPGFDLAGDVVALGPGVSGWEVGDRAFARLPGRVQGACAELVRVDLAVAAQIPDDLDYEHAAAIPLAGMTALQGLRDQGELPMEGATQRVLVVGASGGVGHYAVQIAAAAGAEVIGVCSGRNAELVRSLGAADVIDYTIEDGVGRCGPYDLVYDCVGSLSYWAFRPHIAPGGIYATPIPMQPGTLLALLSSWAIPGPPCRGVRVVSNTSDLSFLASLAERGDLRSVIAATFPFEELAAAQAMSAGGRAAGKIIVRGPGGP